MKRAYLPIAAGLLLAFGSVATATSPTPKEHVFETKPLGMKLSVKMVGPYGEPADLQIICLFRHKAGGEKDTRPDDRADGHERAVPHAQAANER